MSEKLQTITCQAGKTLQSEVPVKQGVGVGVCLLFKEAVIECFHSRGQDLCKFIRTKESICIRKEYNSQRIGLGHQHGRRFIVLEHQYGRRDFM